MFQSVLIPGSLDEIHQANQQLASMPFIDVTTPEGLARARAMQFHPPLALTLIPEDRMIAGPGGDLRLRIFRPQGQPRAVCLAIHGGGWTIGTPEHDDARNEEQARACQMAVVSVDYRLTPEFPFPANIDDCEAAAAWLLANSLAEFGTNRLLITGSSAGGHLAALTLLRIRDRLHAIERVVGASLIFGCYDLSKTPSVRQATNHALVLNERFLTETFRVAFPDRDQEALRDPAISPLYANLAGLPPALLTVGTLDPLLDDSLFLSARWQAAGNQADLDVYPDCPHGFLSFIPTVGRVATQRMNTWFNERLTR